MSPLLRQFLQESREALESISTTLLAMERTPNDVASLGELFRLVHTLKGNSGLFDFPALTSVLHAAEDVMDNVRNGALAFNQQLADQLLSTADYLGEFLDDVESHGQPSEAFRQPPSALVDDLRAWLAPCDRGETVALKTSTTVEPSIAASIEGISDEVRQKLHDVLTEGETVYRVDYLPASDCFFQGTDPLHLVRQLSDVLWRRITPRKPWPSATELDAYDCNLHIELLVICNEAQLTELFRYVADQVKWQSVTLDHLADQDHLSQPSKQSAMTHHADVMAIEPLALDVIRAQRLALDMCLSHSWGSGQQSAIIRTLHNVLISQDCPELFNAFTKAREDAQQQASAIPLMTWLDTQLGTAASGPAASEVISNVAATDSASMRRPEESNTHVTPKVLKIEQEKIDLLMNLIGEIVVAKNGLPYLAERAENHYAQRELAREIKAQYAVVNRIAADLQDAIMQVRMMPVSFVLQRFPRLVRDIARKLNKKVNLIVEGEDTEADKAMIEALADPLVHIVRNSMDHGLELPEERLAAGKAETGTLRIRASQNADHVMIVIEDDGRGIDPQKIKTKVADKQLVEPAALDAMSDQELINLVFLPGFSTAEQISDLSGRGVGMDVVRSGIEKVGGHLHLTSQVGKGTQLSLSLPLSMAVTQVMVIESGQQRFGIPMDQVMETVRLSHEAIHTIKHQPTTQLRGRTIPLRSLNQLLAMPEEQQLNEDGEYALMVLRSRGELVGLIIDDFHGSNDIILKPLVGILGELPGYSGTAVMGDGSILMILNPTELFE